jgi:hypothetical protein
MNLVGVLLYAMIGFGVLFVAAAVLILVFLLFEDFWRRVFHLKKDAALDSKNRSKKE